MILKLEDIYYRYNKKTPYILNGISYDFHKNKLYAIMGESGSGKTTLISIIAALDKPERGKIYYNGVDISTAPMMTTTADAMLNTPSSTVSTTVGHFLSPLLSSITTANANKIHRKMLI